MSKRSKKNRQARPSLVQRTARRGIPRSALVFVAIAIPVLLGFWWWNTKSANVSRASKPMTFAHAANPAVAESKPEFVKLKGRWQRPDGRYILAINSIADSGAIDAAYFNPKSIHVAKAKAWHEADATKVFIELRDVNYPGSN